MKNRKKGNTEKVMLLSALFLMGCTLCTSPKMGKKGDEIPVFRPAQLEAQTEETPLPIQTRAAADESEKPQQAEAMEVFPDEGQDASGGSDAEERDGGIILPVGEKRDESGPASAETEKDSDHLAAEGIFVEKTKKKTKKKAEKKTQVWKDFPDSLWTEDETKTLVKLSCMGGLHERYCVGASDLKPEELLVYAHYSDGSSSRVSPLLFQAEGFSAETPGTFQGKISFQGMDVTVPYEVVDFQAVFHLNGGAFIGARENACHLYDYILESAETPQRAGYVFGGWFLEEDLVTEAEFPFRASEQTTHLYAAWEKYETGYTTEDGILVLPDTCSFVGERAFQNVWERVEEVYVGAGVLEISPGAFLGLDALSYIDVDWKNPHYTTRNCGLHSKDGKRLIAYPNALSGSGRVYAGTEILGSYAFYGSRLSALFLPEKLREIEEYAFGKELKTLRFQGTIPPESISREAFAGISDDLAIEVPEESLESYRKALEEAAPVLAGRITGFRTE